MLRCHGPVLRWEKVATVPDDMMMQMGFGESGGAQPRPIVSRAPTPHLDGSRYPPPRNGTRRNLFVQEKCRGYAVHRWMAAPSAWT